MTLSTVAAVAGISVPTVSKVLRGGTDVSPETRLKVMDAVRAVGYERPGRAKAGAARDETGQPGLIDLVVNHVEGSWANRVLTGVEYEAAAAGLDVVITLARHNGDWASRLLRRRSLGAVVVLVDPTSSQFKALAAAGIPVVLIDPMSKPPINAASVGVANWDGGRIAGEHLLELGHRRIGVVAGARSHMYSRARVDGLRAAVDAAGHEGGTVTVAYGDWSRTQAEAAAHELLDRTPDISAVFACSDVMALGVYDALASRGLRVAEDVSVVGFDDVPEAQWATPQLTTIRQPSAEMGSAAVKLLLESRLRGGDTDRPHPRVEMLTSLVVRASTAAMR
ncbi:LacI family DNA-binding transcriptional regulator [Gryllotalpicola koreensis]|uniref:LacI family DNA-binding transcriptional regulator n=1 Tax=Gryllotalpicola koreensis TaxID=993086 RepID=A0ABP7ZT46_9MICO